MRYKMLSPRLIYFVAALVLVPLLFVLMSGTALAAPPGNDTIGGATAVGGGFSEVLDTSEATTDADDAQLNASCGAPATDASVWYAFTVDSDSTIVVDVSQSNYTAGVLVGVGSPGALYTISCGPGTVAFFASAGTTYYVLAIDDQSDGSGNGGQLNIAFSVIVAPTLDTFTVNPRGKVNTRTGIATISGTYTCNHGDYISVYGDARQQVGRIATIDGYLSFYDYGTCDGLPHQWSADAVPSSGKFAGGKALAVTFAYACGPFECASGYVEQKVQLSGGAKATSAAVADVELFLPAIASGR